MLEGGEGDDVLNGGLGVNTVSYASSNNAVLVDLTRQGTLDSKGAIATTGTAQAGVLGDSSGDYLYGFVNIVGSAFDDTLSGDAKKNWIVGGNGADKIDGVGEGNTIDGGAGDDIIIANKGDVIDGGADFDLIDSWTGATSGITVTLGKDGAQSSVSGGLTLTIKNIESLNGTSFADVFVGNNLANNLVGNDGADKLSGLDGNDILLGGNGDDILTGGAGADELQGEGGNDTASYAGSTKGVTIDLQNNTGKGGDAEGDLLFGIENVTGSNFDDYIVAEDATVNLLDGGAGAGDTISYFGATGGFTIDLGKQYTVMNGVFGGANAQAIAGTGGTGDKLANFENVIGSDGNDKITGNASVNILEGGIGADTLIGVGAGDIVSYAGSSSQVFVSLGAVGGVQATEYDFGSGNAANGDAAGDILSGFAGVIGSKYDDYIIGAVGVAATLSGGDGNDLINGGLQADKLYGGDGDDLLAGGGGSDLINGGAGSDEIRFFGATSGITIALGKNATTAATVSGFAAGTTILDIENILGSLYADKFTGNDSANRFMGGSGNDVFFGMLGIDVLEGGANNDTLDGGAGADILDGGSGIDTVVYSASTSGVTVSLSEQGTYNLGDPDKGRGTTGNAMTGGDAAGDTLWGFENITGSKYDDQLTGDSASNIIDGGDGNDLLEGGVDADYLVGGNGNDTVSYRTSSAVSVSLLGQGTYNATTGVFTGGAEQSLSHAAGDKFSGIENLIGSSVNDTLIGDNNNNVIEGGNGADTLVGLLGSDTVSYASSGAGVTVNLGSSFQGTTDAVGENRTGGAAQSGGHAAGDFLYGFENIIGSEHNDILTAGDNGSTINAGDGDDKLFGTANKADKLYGGAGNDILNVGSSSGGDTLDGGDGIDTADFQFFGMTGLTITLGKNATTAATVSGGAAGIQIFAVENLIGADGADKFTASNEDIDNYFIGGVNNDMLSGMAGEDILEGGLHDDTLIGGADGDILDGGQGFDTVDYTTSSAAVTIEIGVQGKYVNIFDPSEGRSTAPTAQKGGDAEGDLFWGIERVIGSNFNDVLKGGPLSESYWLEGGAGDDLIYATAAQNERLIGGTNGAAGDTISFAGSVVEGVNIDLYRQGTYNSATKTFTGTTQQPAGGDAENDWISGFENVIGSGLTDTIRGDAGNNVIEGGGGGDYLIGGGGIDTVSYKSSFSGVTIRLDDQGAVDKNFIPTGPLPSAQLGGDADGDYLYGFRNIIGSDSAFADYLMGDKNDNVIDGGKGNDHLTGNAGLDTLRGGEGDDLFYAGGAAGAGADTYDGGVGYDYVTYDGETLGVTVTLGANGASATVTGGTNAANDKLISIEWLLGGSGADKFTGNNLAHTLDGNGGDDTLTGGTGDSFLSGGDGNDTIIASTGNIENYDGGINAETAGIGDTLSFATFGANTVVSIDLASNIHTVTGIGNLSATNFEHVIGGAGNDILIGNAFAATKLNGGAGNDRIQGGTAVDTFIGGAGNDIFVFTDAAQGKDIFSDFTNGDKLEINRAGFGGGLTGLDAGALLDQSYLVVGTAPVASVGLHGQFLYNTTNDTLYWDDDGIGANAAVEIGQFGSAVVLKLSDFTLV